MCCPEVLTKMKFFRRFGGLRLLFVVGSLLSLGSHSWNGAPLWAQAAPPSARQIGTVKAASGNSLTISTDAGQQYAITVADGARIVQLPPGSTDLKQARPATVSDIAVGDRVLAVGQAGQANSITASRVILMKSAAIAQRNAAEEADWQKRGTGGIVTAVDPGTGVITISSGEHKIEVKTSGKTIFRRYAGDSVKFEDAKTGTLAQIQHGDQLRVRGDRSADGSSIQAEEIVSGSFLNLSGTLATVDPSAGTITLKDLATKKNMTVAITANSDLRQLPPEMATRFAARQRGGAETAAGAPPQGGAQAGRARAGMDLSRLLARLPQETLAQLHTGEAVMIVASQAQPGSDHVTAVTLLSGVEPILAAAPSGSQAMTLSPWSVGGGGGEPDSGGGGGGAGTP